ncbi:MAG: response regulator [Nitrospirae bacterium]|nr:response regulator [Nitrospirota bacterium]
MAGIDILLIEDNEDDIELTRAALKVGKSIKSLTVLRDGDEALSYLLGHDGTANPPRIIPSLILLDLRLPKVDGVEVLRRIKQEPVLRRIPVIVLTTSQRDEDLVQSYDVGANSFIRKPLLFTAFQAMMKTVELYWTQANIPAAQEPEDPAASQRQPAMNREPQVESILLIEDEPDDIALASQALQQMKGSGSITIARTAEEGLALAGQQDWTMIVLDHQLPGQSGLEVLPTIRRLAPDAGIVMFAGQEDEAVAIAARRAGADYYLKKSSNMAKELVAAARDVAEKRDLRRTLAETRGQYRRVLENMTDLVYELDVEGRFRYVSASVKNLLGYTEQDLIGAHYSAILSPNDLPHDGPHFHERRKGLRATRDLLVRMKTKAGDVKVFAVNASGIYARHRQWSGTTGIARDITERQQTEQALQRSEQMLQWTLEQRERLALDLHDGSIQSIYGIGLGLEYMLQLIGNDHQEVSARLKEAKAGLNGVLAELRNLLVAEPPEFLLPMDLEQAMEGLVQAAHQTTPTRFSLAVDPAALARLTGDRGAQILFILREAISNISKHAQATTGAIRVGLSDGVLRLTIEDDGQGFDLESRQGAGHGLNNMQTRARKLGAGLEILSAPGRGTSLTLLFPKEEGPAGT